MGGSTAGMGVTILCCSYAKQPVSMVCYFSYHKPIFNFTGITLSLILLIWTLCTLLGICCVVYCCCWRQIHTDPQIELLCQLVLFLNYMFAQTFKFSFVLYQTRNLFISPWSLFSLQCNRHTVIWFVKIFSFVAEWRNNFPWTFACYWLKHSRNYFDEKIFDMNEIKVNDGTACYIILMHQLFVSFSLSSLLLSFLL